MKKLLRCLAAVLAMSMLALVAAQPADESATGFVFEDHNGNGRRDASESGIAAVLVSNGVDVVASDVAGKYRLPVKDETILFITRPSGYSVPVDADQIPRFHYIHQPKGTPAKLNLRYRGIEPTGPLPASIDFPLVRTPQPDKFNVLMIADPQPQTSAELDYIRDDFVAAMAGSRAAFGMTLGDIMYDDLALFPRYNRLIAQIGIPWYNVPGNHDLDALAPDDHYAFETFKRLFGPTYYAFEYGSAHFIVLNNVHYKGSNVGREKPHPRGQGIYEGRISATQLEWLANHLKHVPSDKLLVLTTHVPLRTYYGDDPTINTVNRRELFALLKGRKAVHLTGHLHNLEHHYFDAKDGYEGPQALHQQILSTLCGAWWSGPFDERGIPTSVQSDGTPKGYHFLSIDGASYTTSYRALGKAADHQLRITLDADYHRYTKDGMRDFRHGQLLDGRISLDQVFSAEVVVNLFDGGPKSEVSYQIGEGMPVAMTRTLRPDPFVEELYARNAATIKSWVKPDKCTHLWTARLPADLGPGVHTLTVRARNEFGKQHTGRMVLEIAK